MAEYLGTVKGFGSTIGTRSGSKKSGLQMHAYTDYANISVRLAKDASTGRDLYIVEHQITAGAHKGGPVVLAAGFMDTKVYTAVGAAVHAGAVTGAVAATEPVATREVTVVGLAEESEAEAEEEAEAPAWASPSPPATKEPVVLTPSGHEVGSSVLPEKTHKTHNCVSLGIEVGDLFHWKDGAKPEGVDERLLHNDTAIILIEDDGSQAPRFILMRYMYESSELLYHVRYVDLRRLLWGIPIGVSDHELSFSIQPFNTTASRITGAQAEGPIAAWVFAEVEGGGDVKYTVSEDAWASIVRATKGQCQLACLKLDGAPLHPTDLGGKSTPFFATRSQPPWVAVGDVCYSDSSTMVDFKPHHGKVNVVGKTQKCYGDGKWAHSHTALMCPASSIGSIKPERK